MRAQELGHVVVKVRDAQRAEHFYGKTLGIPVAGRTAHPVPMVFFTLGHHHDFAVMELGKNGPSPDRNTAGLAHVAFKVGDSLDEFDATKRELEAAGVVISSTPPAPSRSRSRRRSLGYTGPTPGRALRCKSDG
jgi:catechol 2,3-dioxygenase-like lactoylglutathione lyase family enzyme